jgi:hypothetical protein
MNKVSTGTGSLMDSVIKVFISFSWVITHENDLSSKLLGQVYLFQTHCP